MSCDSGEGYQAGFYSITVQEPRHWLIKWPKTWIVLRRGRLKGAQLIVVRRPSVVLADIDVVGQRPHRYDVAGVEADGTDGGGEK